MAKSLFISENYVKSNSRLDENVDVKLIKPTIIEMQDIYLKQYLGTALFDDLDNKIATATTNANEDRLLKDFIAPMLNKYVLMELTNVLLFRYSNKNISTKSSDNAQPINDTNYTKLVSFHKDRAEYYGKRLIEYLCGNNDLYPTYGTCPNSWDIMPINDSYTCSFYLGGSGLPRYNPNAGKWYLD